MTPRHLVGSRAEPLVHAPNAALLIDFDNVTLGVRSDLTKELRTLLNSDIIKGKVAVQRADADSRMPTPMTYFPYSLSLITSIEKSLSPESRMNVPISGRVNTSSMASIARRMSVAFFFVEPKAGAKMRSIDDSESGTMYCG